MKLKLSKLKFSQIESLLLIREEETTTFTSNIYSLFRLDWTIEDAEHYKVSYKEQSIVHV